MDVTTAIGAAIATTQTLLGLTKAAAGAAVDVHLQGRLGEVNQGILEIQGQLGAAHAERLQLLEEVHELKAKLRAAEDVRAKLDSYTLEEAVPGLFLRKADATHATPHYACPRCFANQKVGVIQVSDQRDGRHRLQCSVCDFSAFTGTPQRRGNAGLAGGAAGGWMAV